MSEQLLDCLGHRRSPAATSAFHAGRSPRNKGLRDPADPPPVEEIVAVMRAAATGAYGVRLRAVLWCCGAVVCESAKRSRWPRPTLTLPGGRCGSGAGYAEFGITREGRQTPGGRHGRVGMAHARPVA
jgi:hypothetical protein